MSKTSFLAVCAAMVFGFSSFGAVTEDPSDHDLGTEPIDVTLAEGEENAYSGVLSGTGGVTLSSPSATTMGGAVRLSGDNTFEGGVTVNGGTVYAEHANALGTGVVTLNAAKANSVAGLVLAADNATISNPITFNGNFDAYTTPDLRFAGNNITYNGPVTLSTKAYIEVVGSGTADNPTEATFDAPDLPDASKTINLKIGEKKAGTAKLHWKTRLGESSANGYTLSLATTSAYGQLLIYSQNNELAKFNMGNASVVCMAKNVFGNQDSRACYLDDGQPAKTDQYGYFDLNGYDQCVAYLGLDKSTNEEFVPSRVGPEITSKSGPATLRIYRNAVNTNVTSFVLAGQLSILLDSKSADMKAKQYFANRTHSTSGDLIVSNGTLGVTMATTFTNLKRIIVGRKKSTAYGIFDSQTTCDNAFPRLEELIVDGVFTHTGSGTDIFPTDGTMSLTITENGVFSMSAGTVLNVKEATLGTTTYTTPGTVLTSVDSALIPEGVTIKIPMPSFVVTTEDMTAQGDWEVTVDKGNTNVVRAAQTGSGKIIKKGEGLLILEKANSYSGGTQIDAGIVQVTTGDTLGSGTVTIKGSTTDPCALQFGQLDAGDAGKTIVFANDIVIEGAGSLNTPQLMFGPHGEKNYRHTLKLTGDITCAGDLYFNLVNTMNTAGPPYLYLEGDVTIDGNLDFNQPSFSVYIKKSIRMKELTRSGATGSRAVCLYSSENAIEKITFNRNEIVCYGEQALGGAWMNYVYLANVAPMLRMETYSQTAAYLTTSDYTTDARRKYLPVVAATGSATLTLTGGVESAMFEGYFGTIATGNELNNKISLEIAPTAGAFTQTFTGANHLMDGTITVEKGGAAVFDGATSLSNLTGIAVNGGSFKLDTTVVSALRSLKSLSVTDGGSFTVTTCDAFETEMDVALDSDATLSIPSGTTIAVKTLTVDGEGQTKGTYTKTQLGFLPEGVTLDVKNSLIVEVDAEWTGAGADNLTTTLENWLIDGEVPTKINTKSGSLNVTLTGGDGIQYADGDTFNKIVNTIPVTNLEGVVASTFVIEPVTEGATLTLVEGLSSTKMTQIKLCGHIQGPDGDVTKGEIFYYCAACTKDMPFIQPVNKYGSVAPLVLDNVTIDMPLRVQVHGNASGLMADGGGTSVVNGSMRFTDYRAYASVEKDTELVFNGKVSTDNCYSYCGPGRTVINESDLTFKCGIESVKNGWLVFGGTNNAVTGNSAREGATISSGTFELLKSGTFVDDVQLVVGAEKSVLEINGTQQTLGRLRSVATANTSYLHGDYPAMIELTCKVRSGATETEVVLPYCSARVTGGLGFHLNDQDGGTNIFTLAGRDFESCGDLVVSAGTLELANDATWLNGTNFTAKGTGVLKFGKQGQVNAGFAAIHLADDGKLFIPDGVTVVVPTAKLDNAALDRGVYTGAEGVLKDRILGGGALKVGARGMAVLIQ